MTCAELSSASTFSLYNKDNTESSKASDIE